MRLPERSCCCACLRTDRENNANRHTSHEMVGFITAMFIRGVFVTAMRVVYQSDVPGSCFPCSRICEPSLSVIQVSN